MSNSKITAASKTCILKVGNDHLSLVTSTITDNSNKIIPFQCNQEVNKKLQPNKIKTSTVRLLLVVFVFHQKCICILRFLIDIDTSDEKSLFR